MRNRSLNAWGFIAFPLAIIFIFTALPTLVGVALSFFEWSGGGTPRFIGLQNYTDAFNSMAFWHAARNTIIFSIITVPVTVVIAFLLAVAVNAPWFVGRTIMRTIFFLPTIVSIVAIGFIWRWVLDPSDSGLLNHVLTNLPGGFAFEKSRLPDWLGNNGWGLTSIIVVSIWRAIGFSMVLYLAALSQVPRSLYDAAAVDGAGGWQTMWQITWPLVSPMTWFLLITGMIGALQIFDMVLVMIGSFEQEWTDVLNLYLYREFRADRLGFAASIGVILLIVTFVVTAMQLGWLKRADGSAIA